MFTYFSPNLLCIASSNKGGALDVSGAARDLCLKVSAVLLLSSVLSGFPVDGSPGEKTASVETASVDRSFC